MFAGRGLKKIINVFTDSFDKERAILSENGRAKKEGGWELFLLSFAKRSQKSFKRVRKVQNFITSCYVKMLKKTGGFTLAELVVGMGITGTLTVSMIYLVGLRTDSDIDSNLIDARRTIEEFISNGRICKATLSGLSPNGPVSAIKAPDGTDLLKTSKKIGKVKIKQMSIKNLGVITDKKAALNSSDIMKGGNVLYLLEFNALLTVKNSRGKVKEYVKKVTFTGVVDTTNSSLPKIVSCVEDVSYGAKESERALCVNMGDTVAWDAVSGKCKAKEVQRTVAQNAAKYMCSSKGGIFGKLDPITKECIPPYYGADCKKCEEGSGEFWWVTEIGPQGGVKCTDGTKICDLDDSSFRDRKDPDNEPDEACPKEKGSNYKWAPSSGTVKGKCLKTCKQALIDAGHRGVSTNLDSYSGQTAPTCGGLNVGGKTWVAFYRSTEVYEAYKRPQEICCKEDTSGGSPTCPPCPPGQTPGAFPNCICSGGTCPTTPCSIAGQTRGPPPLCRCSGGTCPTAPCPTAGETRGPAPVCACGPPQRCPPSPLILAAIPQSECGPISKCGWQSNRCLLTCQEIAMWTQNAPASRQTRRYIRNTWRQSLGDKKIN